MKKVKEFIKVIIVGGGIAAILGYIIHLERRDMLRAAECWRIQEVNFSWSDGIKRIVYFDCDDWENLIEENKNEPKSID